MRILTHLVFVFIITILSMTNCAQSSKQSRKPVTSIQLKGSNKNHTIGDILTINLETKIRNGSINKTELFLDGNMLTSSNETQFSYSLDTKNLMVGTHFLKTISTKEDGVIGENFQNFLLLSDLKPEKFGYKIVNSYPHNTAYFTEGLEIHNGYLYESTGQEGGSYIYKINLSNWKTIKQTKLDDKYFGEGITILNNKIYQLTYKTQIGFVRDLNTFEIIKTWNYKNEQGWGLTNDGQYLIMSDGTQFITYLDPETLNVIKKIEVCNNKSVVTNINELEYINGEIWANIWMTDTIVKIDSKTGKILAEIDLKGLLNTQLLNQNTQVDVLNGIAYDAEKNRILVTGKFWPKIFEIELVKN